MSFTPQEMEDLFADPFVPDDLYPNHLRAWINEAKKTPQHKILVEASALIAVDNILAWQRRRIEGLIAAVGAIRPDRAEFMALLERSSLGTDKAKALRATISDERAADVVRRSMLPPVLGVTTEEKP